MYDWGTLQKIDRWWNHGELVLMESTGLKDTSGKEIYVGDFVQWNRKGRKKMIFLIQFSKGRYACYSVFPSTKVINQHLDYIYEDCQLVGNIYKNLITDYAKNN